MPRKTKAQLIKEHKKAIEDINLLRDVNRRALRGEIDALNAVLDGIKYVFKKDFNFGGYNSEADNEKLISMISSLKTENHMLRESSSGSANMLEEILRYQLDMPKRIPKQEDSSH